MLFKCTRCNKEFRDHFNLNRHNQKKKTCNQSKVVTPKQLINVNNFGSEDLSHINVETLIDRWREINQITTQEYLRAVNLLTSFHNLVNQNLVNKNVVLPSIKSTIVKINTESGIVKEPVLNVVERVIKTRATQLVTFKESIKSVNQRIFDSKRNCDTWTHIEQFGKAGTAHRSTFNNNRALKTNVKIALL